MHVLIGIALKSLIVAGLTLGLLQLLRNRSAAERSWVAHIGLLALVVMALAPLILPSWNVEAPALVDHVQPAPSPSRDSAAPLLPASTTAAAAPASVTPRPVVKGPSLSAAAAATALYAVPAALLLLITALALGRLIALRARADVLVDGHWLSALARAQRRMGFKHGTALLTSNELASPISWGLMRPVILLNTRAVEAAGEAEAIIAHELAHVARMDWIKLLLARVATALFWFNPLVWLLAREAHQLREEAADDAVLASDIADTDYAQLLVGVARHECPGLLLGAHGVAPSKSSLARRVARVLDGKSVRGPVARSFALGVFSGAMLVAAPLAALTLTPAGSTKPDKSAAATGNQGNGKAPYYAAAADLPTDLPSIIASGVSTAVAAVALPAEREVAQDVREDAISNAVETAREARDAALERVAEARVEARPVVLPRPGPLPAIDDLIALKTSGVTADYVNAMRAAVPALRSLEPAEFAGLKAVGVTPDYARALVASGFGRIDSESLTEARAVGLDPQYVKGLVGAGVPPNIDHYVQLRAVGVPVEFVRSVRRAGYSVSDADKLVEMWAVGVRAEDLSVAPLPPKPPKSPRTGRPAASPPDWDLPDPDEDG